MPKDKPEDELDAVSAAYESISAKLDELRKKQAESSDASPQSSDKSKKDEGTDNRRQTTDDDDDEAIAEIDIDSEEEIEVEVTPKKKSTANEEEELIEPLPGTEDAPELPKKQIYKQDDPLDDESTADSDQPSDDRRQTTDDSKEDDFEDETEGEVESLRARGAKLQADADEMQKWEQLNQGKSLSGQDLDSEDDEPVATKPTFTPLSQDEFQNRIRRPQEEDELPPRTESRSMPEPDEVDSLDDLAEETVEPKNETAFSRVNRPTATDALDDDWDIRHLKPKHASSFGQEDDVEFDTPQREFRRPPVQEENYFDRRNQPLPRKKASFWHLLILLLIGAGVIGATVYFLKYQFNEPAKPTPSPEISTPTPVATPTPTPVPTISDRSGFTVRVLNGTSKTGLAGTILTKLKDAGFKTDRSGNATNSAFEQTIIRVKEGSQSTALVETVIKDLGAEFSPVSETTLKSNDKADVEVILGQK